MGDSRCANRPVYVLLQIYPSVAQPGSATALGAEGREFESLHSDHFEGVTA